MSVLPSAIPAGLAAQQPGCWLPVLVCGDCESIVLDIGGEYADQQEAWDVAEEELRLARKSWHCEECRHKKDLEEERL